MTRRLFVLATILTGAAALVVFAIRWRASHARAERIAATLAGLGGGVVQLEGRARRLSARWADIAAARRAETAAFETARDSFDETSQHAALAATSFEKAKAAFDAAERRWRLYEALVVVAAQIDASRLDSFRRLNLGEVRTLEASCERVSTSEMRRILTAAGMNLAGKDIDHLVPKSRGGADHPSNYQVLDSSLNRSLGATWNRDKCLMAGVQRCADAVAVSRSCGWYRGRLF